MGSGYKPFTAASVLTSADVNDYLMEQSVMFFETTAARDAAITAPEDGMVAYIASVGLFVYDGATWVPAIRTAASISYTPALTASTTDPSRGTGGFPEATGFYSQNGNIVTGYARVAAGNTSVTAGSGTYRISLPVTCKMGTFTGRGVVVGSAYYTDASAPTVNYVATAVATDGGTYAIFRTVAGAIGSTLPGLANNDFIQFNFTYEAD